MTDALTLIVPGDPGQRTGGYLYDARIVEELRRLGWSVKVIGLAGRFPDADDRARRSMDEALSQLSDGDRVVIDGLALGGVPGAVDPHARRLNIIALIHHPLADETGIDARLRERLLARERRALAACRRVIVTSTFTARRLQALGLAGAAPSVVEPGVDAAPAADAVVARLQGTEPAGGERLLCVASLTPRKGQDILIEALGGLGDRDWHCVLAGSMDRDPTFAGRVRALIDQAGLVGRVDCRGECDAAALDAEWQRATVCVLPSHYEGYGMVVSEALARGLPVITTTGGALADTAPGDCCIRVDPGDVAGLRDALRAWLDDAALRRRLMRAAVSRRERLGGWAQAGRTFAAALGEAPR